MANLSFTTTIGATRERVWQILWEDATYRKWTAVFSEGSFAESDWKQGSEIRFLSPSGNGMYSIIEKKVQPEVMIFRHLGEIKNGIKEAKEWGEALEQYFLIDLDNKTILQVELNTIEEFKQYFLDTFPAALQELKKLAETNN